MPALKTLEKFIEKSKLKHPNENYDYSKFIYRNNKTKGIIICSIHGEFDQNPNDHLNGSGCNKCGGTVKSNTNDFIIKAKLIHPDNDYDYSKFIYKNTHTKGIIICKDHGEFNQRPCNHLNGRGCDRCGIDKITKTLEQFIEKANIIHPNKGYDYSVVNYVNSYTEITIICKKHGKFDQLPNNHLNGNGCNKCQINKITDTLEQFIEKANIIHLNKKYDYSKVNYVNSKTKVTIICKKHGEFDQRPNNHLNGSGCDKCSPCKKINEKIVKKFLLNNNINFIEEYKVKLPANKDKYFSKVDFYIPLLNLFIEYNGAQHYQPIQYGNRSIEKAEKVFKYQQKRDEQLKQYCNDNNINLLEIDGREYQGKNLTKYLYSYFFNIITMNNIYS